MTVRLIAAALLVLALTPASAQTRHNDDSCEIVTAPAATLLLPYFEVDLEAIAGASDTTQFTVTNVSPLPQIAHVTLWSDWAYPVLSFNIFLTGYDVQTINLYDVLVRGIVAPPRGTSSWDARVSPNGSGPLLPANNSANPNIDPAAIVRDGACGNLPGELSPAVMAEVRQALTTSLSSSDCGQNRVGGVHMNAIGYATIDVVSTCSSRMPDEPGYLAGELLFDNVLIGDYQQIDGDPSAGNYAQANPMVHIRAIPEGGPAGSNPGTNLPYTFYDRYTIGLGRPRTFDRRQPLPAVFAARWIAGGSSQYSTNYKMWREGLSVGRQTCAGAVDNSAMQLADVVKFDEQENSYGFTQTFICLCPRLPPQSPATGSYPVWESMLFPTIFTADTAGWVYLNLNNGGSTVRPSQNWVVISMSAQGRYSVDFPAAVMGNGCSPAAVTPATAIAPAANPNP